LGVVGEVGKSGVVGGGVETTVERDEFTSHLHMDEHFAPGFVVVASGGENVLDVTLYGFFGDG